MSQFWSPDVHRLTPYVPGEQPQIEGLIKLNTNENPYGPSPRALAAMREWVGDWLRLYPDPDAMQLKEEWAEQTGLDPSQVFVGNGSDEVLAHVFRALLSHGRPVLTPDISYSFYPVYCQLFGIEHQPVPLAADFTVRIEDYRGRANGGIVIANPNAPTGIALAPERIERLLADHPGSVVVIDEAYVDFGGESVIPLIATHPNLLVVQTLSKSMSLAGLRVGAAFGQPELIEGLNRVKNSFNSYPLGRLAIAGAVAALEDREWLESIRTRVMDTRSWLQADLRTLGFEVSPSSANFVFVHHPKFSGEQLASHLRDHRILVRHFRRPRIENHLRITIGTDDQCRALVGALAALVRGED